MFGNCGECANTLRPFLPWIILYPTRALMSFKSAQPTGGSRSAEIAFVGPWRLPPVAHAHSWAASLLHTI
jgi:hypothetical protein